MKLQINKNIDFFYLLVRTLTVVVAFYVGGVISHRFNDMSFYLGATLSSISAVIIIGDMDFSHSLTTGWRRIVASFIGAFIGSLYFLFFNYSLIGLAICTSIITLLALMFSFKGYGRIATVVLIWIFMKSATSDISPFLNGILRFIESTIGVLIGLLSVWMLLLKKKWLTKKDEDNF